MNQIKVELKQDVFKKNPSDWKEKLGGHELPINHFEKVEYPAEGGMLCYYKIFMFPTKGVPAGPAVHLITVIKKIILGSITIATNSPFRYLLALLLLLPKKTKQRALFFALREFFKIADWTFDRWNLERKGMCIMCRELHEKVSLYIEENFTGEAKELCDKALLCFCMILEYDSAYRYRFQDLAMELNKENLKKDIYKELERIVKEEMKRERIGGIDVAEKISPFMRIIKLLLWFKKDIAKTIIEIVDRLDLTGVSWNDLNASDFPKLPPQGTVQRIGRDHADWYHCLNTPTYDFGHRNLGERFALRRKIDKEWAEELRKQGKIDNEGRIIKPIH